MINKIHIVSFTCDKCGKTEDISLILNEDSTVPSVGLPFGWHKDEDYLYCDKHLVFKDMDVDDYEAGSILFSLQKESQESYEDILKIYFRHGPFEDIEQLEKFVRKNKSNL